MTAWVSRRRRLVSICLAFLVGLGLAGCRREEVPAAFFNEPLPADAAYTGATSSPHFAVRGTVTLGDEVAEGRREVRFEVTVENRTEQPIRGLRVKAELPEAVRAYRDPGYAHFRVFGGPEPIDLVPGQVPLGLVSGCSEPLPDPATIAPVEREKLYAALQQPIRLHLQWQGGEECLEVQPQDVLYTGFSQWIAPVPESGLASSEWGGYEFTLTAGLQDPTRTKVCMRRAGDDASEFCVAVPDLYREHYHNVEFHNGCLYAIRRLGYDGHPDEDWSDELWRYDGAGQGTRLASLQGLDFRVAPDEAYIAISRPSEGRLAFIDSTARQRGEYPIKELSVQDPARPPAERLISPLSWSADGRGFWGAITLGPQAEGFFRVEPGAGEVTIYDVSGLPMAWEYDLDPDTGRVAFSDYPALFDADSAESFMESGKAVTLYVHDLATGETQVIATSAAMAFRPRWLGDGTLEYEDPAGGGRPRVLCRIL